ncbi:MAG: type II toxin-antitoxin system Phd/YefM family antitoxin [Patescibacteria group bacterium]|nr:type II toxin-antitoxin system Phd/YefM family antitoxin [Patescibacteria group bacterium]
MNKTISITEARKNIFKITNDVQKSDTRYTLTENGKPKAIIMSVEEFESWQETVEVAYLFPNLSKDIEKVEKDIKSGAHKKYITLDQLLEKEGFVKTNK